MESLQHFKKPWAHEHEPIKGLVNAVKVGISVECTKISIRKLPWLKMDGDLSY